MSTDKNQHPNRGEVWFVEFPREEDNRIIDNRPVIVLEDSDDELEVLSVKVTKHKPRDEWDYNIVYWQEASLKFESTARISKSLYLKEDSFLFKIGDLRKEDLSKIDNLFDKYTENLYK
ncbi:type II toxin-antitoxin system PemK/MazF family toxin [Clostridium thermobutyricum]|uniref:PemK-like protein n=1 Tax=Clostridium thermobutyricum DSM 4928 TaxID=1121339 RepID=A0A1V4SZ63_9CLOT|nr:type II toxin-antitoxin system PemK/MazF family toxin [Clostridium thermobutyricum]OPX50908.1 PemK-like protein [Clostridium thermobutyricum DSM 4928]